MLPNLVLKVNKRGWTPCAENGSRLRELKGQTRCSKTLLSNALLTRAENACRPIQRLITVLGAPPLSVPSAAALLV